MRLRRLAALLTGALMLPVLLVAAGSLAARSAQTSNLQDLSRLEDQRLTNQQLLTGMVDQETGVRGYTNTALVEFLTPYRLGSAEYSDALAKLRKTAFGSQSRELDRVQAAAMAWQAWASDRVAAVAVSGSPILDVGASQTGKQLFDSFRSADSGYASILAATARTEGQRANRRITSLSVLVLALLAINLAVAAGVATVLLRRVVSPVEALAAAASDIAGGRSAPLPYRGRRDEVGSLARALEEWRSTADARLDLARGVVEFSQRTDLQEILELGGGRLLSVLRAAEVVITVVGPSGPVVAAAQPDPFDPGRFLMRSPGGEALSSGENVIADLGDERWDPDVIAWARRLGLGPALGMPMMVAGELVGAATVLRRSEEESFTQSDVQWASLVLPPLAAAIKTAGLLEELGRTNEALIRADAHKSQFLANMSHELRTPLNSILGFADLLLSRHAQAWGDAKAERFLGIIRTSGQDLLGLINDILDLSKIDAGRVRIEPQPLAVGALAHEVLQSVEPLVRAKELRMNAAIDGSLEMVGDPRLLRQMLLNLVSNAIKFTPRNGTIGVEVRAEAGTVVLTVADSGIGIAPQDQARIFSPFEQVAAAAAGQSQGTGLGLALVKRIAELHRGSITVESELEKGTRFIVQVPQDAFDGQGSHDAQAERDPEPTSGRPLVLVVEDDDDAIDILREHITRAGFDVVVARDGEDALVKAHRLRPAAITLDVILPTIQGWDLLSRLKLDEATRQIPVLVVSVVDNPSLARALGAVDYLVKPVDPTVLIGILEGLLDGRARPPARILAIDDSQEQLELLAGHLGDAGFTVDVSADGAAGLELARTRAPAAILLDLMMPGLSGFEILKALKAEPSTRNIPIIVVTAKELSAEDREVLSGQTLAVLAKSPEASIEVVSLLGQLVAGRSPEERSA